MIGPLVVTRQGKGGAAPSLPYHRAVLLGGQRRLQRPIGEYFVERGLLGSADLGRLASQAWAHSLRFDPPL